MTGSSPTNDESTLGVWVMVTQPTGPGPALLIDRGRGRQAFGFGLKGYVKFLRPRT
jgi:hypothetical protein